MESLVVQAMREHLCVRATYNRGLVRLAPHILYRRHDAPFLDAVVVERDGVVPGEIKLASFRLSGLKGVAMTMESFAPIASFNLSEERYAGVTIAALDIG
jgi:hypothetical protein